MNPRVFGDISGNSIFYSWVGVGNFRVDFEAHMAQRFWGDTLGALPVLLGWGAHRGWCRGLVVVVFGSLGYSVSGWVISLEIAKLAGY